MKKYTKTHVNSKALANHKKALQKRGAEVSVKGKTVTYSFPEKIWTKKGDGYVHKSGYTIELEYSKGDIDDNDERVSQNLYAIYSPKNEQVSSEAVSLKEAKEEVLFILTLD